ncbi:MAG TPA: hypothetical protein VN872_13710, partial [Candidatus Acidoferrum sp.]|nr:hypothetical protein [Candidatus Acidoferrum sp.]
IFLASPSNILTVCQGVVLFHCLVLLPPSISLLTPFRWRHNRDSVMHTSVEIHVLSFTVTPNGKEGERHE